MVGIVESHSQSEKYPCRRHRHQISYCQVRSIDVASQDQGARWGGSKPHFGRGDCNGSVSSDTCRKALSLNLQHQRRISHNIRCDIKEAKIHEKGLDQD